MNTEHSIRTLCHAILKEREMDRDSWFRDCLREAAVEILADLGAPSPPEPSECSTGRDESRKKHLGSESSMPHISCPRCRTSSMAKPETVQAVVDAMTCVVEHHCPGCGTTLRCTSHAATWSWADVGASQAHENGTR